VGGGERGETRDEHVEARAWRRVGERDKAEKISFFKAEKKKLCEKGGF
jgi:hypothetical protein